MLKMIIIAKLLLFRMLRTGLLCLFAVAVVALVNERSGLIVAAESVVAVVVVQLPELAFVEFLPPVVVLGRRRC